VRGHTVRAFLATLVLVSLVASAAVAEPSQGDLGTARRLFQEATVLEQRSEWREASMKLDEALAIKETPGLHFHRAHCAEQLGELVVAARHYERADQMIRAGAAAPDVEELLAAARTRVLARVPRVTLSLPSGIEGATVEIDGSSIPDAQRSPVYLEPGGHKVVARAPGYVDFKAEITLLEGQSRTLEVVFLEAERPSASPDLPQSKQQQGAADTSGFGAREIVLVSEVTVTLAALGTGIGFSIARGSAANRIADAQHEVDAASAIEGDTVCRTADAPTACAELQSALADHERATRNATIGFVAAGVGAGATLLTWALWPSERAIATVHSAPGGALVELSGRF
jgi:hypothetical protein